MAYVPAERHIFPGLSVEENLKLAARPGNGPAAGPWKKCTNSFPFWPTGPIRTVRRSAAGEQQMLAIGRALISNPKIIILDEPSQGLSPLIVERVTEVVINFCVNSGITLLVVEQNYRMALKVADRHYLMGTKGQIAGVATTQELVDNPQIIHDHLSV